MKSTPTPDQDQERQRKQALERQGLLEEERRIGHAMLENLQKREKLPTEDRSTIARNFGRLIETAWRAR